MKLALVLSCLVCGSFAPAAAQTLDLSQNAQNNFAIIAPGTASTNVTVSQVGRSNNALTEQYGQNNAVTVDQWGGRNYSNIQQNGVTNQAVIQQQANFKPVANLPTSYVGEATSYGYLSSFTSGSVSILALTGPGSTYLSTFGRGH
jgi:Curlin associated repeat